MTDKAERHEFLIAIGYPIIVAGLNQFALYLLGTARTSTIWQATGCLAMFVVIVATTSVVCGRFLKNWLRWLVFGWTLLALDLMIFVVGGRSALNTIEMLACAMISGQLGAIVVWGVLVEQKWWIPFLIAFATVAGGIVCWNTVFGTLERGWYPLMMFQALALAIMCVAMRRRGFRLAKARYGRGEQQPSSPFWQFSMKEFLLLMAVVATVITIARFSISLQRIGYMTNSPLAVAVEAMLGVLIATVLLTAIWVALGSNSFETRLTTGVVTTLLVGVIVSAASSFSWDLVMSRPWVRYQHHFAWMIWHRWWWLPWLCLASGFLTSTLWFLREIGYVITRQMSDNRRQASSFVNVRDLGRSA